jgi:hypothetical protein
VATTLWAEIVEVASGKLVDKVEATVSGRPWFLMAGIFPLGAPSFTEPATSWGRASSRPWTPLELGGHEKDHHDRIGIVGRSLSITGLFGADIG